MHISKLSQIQLLEKVSRREGLPSHQIHNVCFSQRKLWLSTPNGLAVYDGEEVEILNQSTGLLTHGQRSVSSHGDLILACSDLGLNILDAKTLSVLTSIATVEHAIGWCQCSLLMTDNIYLLGCGKGLYLWNSISSELSQVSTEISGEGVLNMVQSPDNLVLIQMSQSGIWVFKNGVLERLFKQDTNVFKNIEHINISKSGFFITNDKNILSLDFELNLKEQIPIPSGNASPVKVLEPQSSLLVVADNEKAYELIKQNGVWIEGKRICENIQINDLNYDNFNNLWIATEYSGLYKYSALNHYIQCFTTQKPISILAIRPTPNKHELLIGGTGLSYIVSTSNQNSSNEIKALKNLTCWDLYQDSSCAIWAASSQGLAYVESNEQSTATFFRNKEVGAGRCIQAIDENFLYGSVYGLFIFSRKFGTFSAINDDKNNTLSYIYSIVRKNSNQFFITTLGRCLWIYDSKNESISQVSLLKPYLNIYDIDGDKNERYIIAADNKILLMENEQLKIICETNDSVAAWTCRWYNDSSILLGTSKGLRVFNINLRKFEYQINDIPEHQSWEFTTSRSLAKCENNQYWCGLNESLVSIKLEQLLDVVQPPIPEIRSIKSSANFEQQGTSVVFKKGDWNIDIELCSYWLWNEKSILYLYRLVGIHDNWRQAQNIPIMYSALPAGEYILEIQVLNGLAQSNQQYQLLLLKVSREGYLSNVLNTLKGLLIDLRIKFFRRWSFWKLHESHLELERLVEHRTRELSLANQQLHLANESLEQLSNRDQLTGLYNRRAFLKFTNDELKRAGRQNSVFGILMIDIDYFKLYNDNYGHLAGDLCIKQVADCLSGCVHRGGDILARYGGEEFVIALPDTDLKKIRQFASICVNSIRDRAIKHEFSLVSSHITISVGVSIATVNQGLTNNQRSEFLSGLIDQADTNLYKAKEKGRDRYISDGLTQLNPLELSQEKQQKTDET